jgi:hypothetical protein
VLLLGFGLENRFYEGCRILTNGRSDGGWWGKCSFSAALQDYRIKRGVLWQKMGAIRR